MGFFSKLFGSKKKKEVTVNKVEEKKMGVKLADSDFDKIAVEFGLKPAHIRAIFTVEAGGKSGFLTDNPEIPVTLEEGHIFYKYLKQKGRDAVELAKIYPTICYPKWTKEFYKKGLNEYSRYLLAKDVDEECAMLATSWGMGQLMGFNYASAGYKNVKSFVEAMYESEYNQLMAMCKFIQSNKSMYEALKTENWAKFAKLYNGSGYAANKYDEKLKKAFEKWNKTE